jgi:hypothetical protein
VSGPRKRDLLIGLGCLAVLAIAFALEPSPKGWGTHRKLPLPPCWFRVITGKPCATCGLTTSYCEVARGRLDRAFDANPAGLVLFPLTAVVAVLALWGAATGRSRIGWFLNAWGGKAWIVILPLLGLLWAWQILKA